MQNIDGQLAVVVFLRDIINDIKEKARKLKERTADKLGQIEKHRYIAHNSWVVAGTRIPTKTIKHFHEAGFSVDQILQEYPTLTRQDVEAALAHEEGLAKSA